MLLLTLIAPLVCGAPQEAERGPAASPADREGIVRAIDDGLDFLVASQNADGSFGGHKNATFTSAFGNRATYKCWQIGASALATRSLLELGDEPAQHEAADRGLDFLIANQRVVRPAEWDVDNNWAIIYALDCVSLALQQERLQGTERHAELRGAGETLLKGLAKYQSPRGGWGYYADPEAGWRPEWATSFTTAAGVLAMVEAERAGLPVDEKVFRAGVKAVRRSRLPSGAYEYSVNAVPRHLSLESINQLKGSLGRIQVCNLALYQVRDRFPEVADVEEDDLVEGLEQFVKHHKFLDVARNKPIPHEAYYANAAYFYLFAHYYASRVLGEIPAPRRAAFGPFIQGGILKTDQKDGSMWDFWIASNTQAYGTGFGVLGLQHTLDSAR